MLKLNTKEKSLLEDAKEHETLCVAKYKDHAEKTNCQELKLSLIHIYIRKGK